MPTLRALSLLAVIGCSHPRPLPPAKHLPIGAHSVLAFPDAQPFGAPSVTPRPRLDTLAPHPMTTFDLRFRAEDEDDEPALVSEHGSIAHCPRTLAACPLTGCALPGNGEARSNEIKHGDPDRPKGTPIVVPIEVFADLQDAAEPIAPEGAYPPASTRDDLRMLSIRGKTIGEGARVKVTGYIVGVKAEGPESVNCKIKNVENNDFHIALAADASADEFDGIVVEMIPQDRPESWTPSALKKLAVNGTQVLVMGQLFYDAKHRVNRDANHPIGGQPKRFSV